MQRSDRWEIQQGTNSRRKVPLRWRITLKDYPPHGKRIENKSIYITHSNCGYNKCDLSNLLQVVCMNCNQLTSQGIQRAPITLQFEGIAFIIPCHVFCVKKENEILAMRAFKGKARIFENCSHQQSVHSCASHIHTYIYIYIFLYRHQFPIRNSPAIYRVLVYRSSRNH